MDFPNHRVGEVLRNASPVLLLGDLLLERRKVVLRQRVLNVRQKLGPATDEVPTPAQEIARWTPLGRVDVGKRKIASAHGACDLVSVLAIVLSLRAADGSHVEGVTEDEGNAFPPAQIG